MSNERPMRKAHVTQGSRRPATPAYARPWHTPIDGAFVAAVCLIVACCSLGSGSLCAADEGVTRVTFPSESTATARRLADADRLAADGKWDEAIAEYQRILDEAGDTLVTRTPT